MNTKRIFLYLLISSVFFVSELCNAQSTPISGFVPRWVHGSWVNVRSLPSADSSVLAKLVVNTPVQVLPTSGKDKYCEVIWGESQHGFLACNLLGERPLTIEAVGNPEQDSDKSVNQKYSATRAFWIEPSFKRLQEAGEYFWRTMLTPQQKALESIDVDNPSFEWDKRPTLRRFLIPEFEAMKEVMKKGVIAPQRYRYFSYRPGPVLWRDMKRAVSSKENLTSHLGQFDDRMLTYLTPMLQQVELPSIRLSYFKTVNDIGRPSADTEELSFQFKIPYAINILNGASWQNGHHSGIYRFGSWDMGETDFVLTETLHKTTISNRGVIRSDLNFEHSSFKIDDELGGDCTEGYQFGSREADIAFESSKQTQLRTNKTVVDFPLFFFYTREPVAYQRAKIYNEVRRELKSKEVNHEREAFTHGEMKLFDIDGDSIFDFAVWEGLRIPSSSEVNLSEPNYRLVFVNAGGQWYLLDIDDYIHMCGC